MTRSSAAFVVRSTARARFKLSLGPIVGGGAVIQGRIGKSAIWSLLGKTAQGVPAAIEASKQETEKTFSLSPSGRVEALTFR
jgi:hypothetical protein